MKTLNDFIECIHWFNSIFSSNFIVWKRCENAYFHTKTRFRNCSMTQFTFSVTIVWRCVRKIHETFQFNSFKSNLRNIRLHYTDYRHLSFWKCLTILTQVLITIKIWCGIWDRISLDFDTSVHNEWLNFTKWWWNSIS